MHSYFIAALFFAGVVVSGSLACDLGAVGGCAAGMQEMQQAAQAQDIGKLCQVYNSAMSCFQTALDGCKGDQAQSFNQMMSQISGSYGSMCSGGAAGQGSEGCAPELMKCYNPIKSQLEKSKEQPEPSVLCPIVAQVKQCMAKIGDDCKSTEVGAGMVQNLAPLAGMCSSQQGGGQQGGSGNESESVQDKEAKEDKKDAGDNNGVGAVQPWALVAEIENCKREYPTAKVRVIAYDSVKQVQAAAFMVRN